MLRCAVAWEPEARYADAGAMVLGLRAAMSRDLRAKVVDGGAGSGAEAGGAVHLGVISATPGAISIVSPLPAVPIAPGAPMLPSPGAQSAGGLPLESQVSGGGSQQGEPARSARGASSADDTQNLPRVTGSGAIQSRDAQVAANKPAAPAFPAPAKTTVDLHACDRAANPPRPVGVQPCVDTAGTTVRDHSAPESPHRRSASVIAAIVLAGTAVAVGTLYVALKGGSLDSSIIDDSISCNGGRVPVSGHCCWSGQTFDADKKACDGKPECPKELLTANADCVMAWIGDWSGSLHQDPRAFVSSYDAYFAIHLQEIDRQSGQCGSFKQAIEHPEGGHAIAISIRAKPRGMDSLLMLSRQQAVTIWAARWFHSRQL